MNKQLILRFLSYANALFLVFAFVLAAWLSTRYYYEADVTRSGRHTLSQASQELLLKADKPLSITAYARENSELRELIKKFVRKFQKAKTDISLQFVNPDAVPDEVRALGINVNGELILRYDGRTEHVKSENEQEFVNALQRLLRKKERWLAFIEGHGERNPVGKANHDVGEFAAQLKYRGFNSLAINLAETKVVPDNTSVLVVASPLVPLLEGEIAIISDYLAKGGNLLWLTDPGDPSFIQQLTDITGVRPDEGVIIDTAGQLLGINDPTITLTTARLYPLHTATADFDMTVFFPKATALLSEGHKDWKTKVLLQSGSHTWLEKGELQGSIDFDAGSERQGPLHLGISLERELNGVQQRLVIIGDGDFLSNTYIGNHGNMELGIRLVNWLTHDEEFINLPQRVIEDSQLNMSQVLTGTFGVLLLLVFPAGYLIAGFVTWWRRKNA